MQENPFTDAHKFTVLRQLHGIADARVCVELVSTMCSSVHTHTQTVYDKCSHNLHVLGGAAWLHALLAMFLDKIYLFKRNTVTHIHTHVEEQILPEFLVPCERERVVGRKRMPGCQATENIAIAISTRVVVVVYSFSVSVCWAFLYSRQHENASQTHCTLSRHSEKMDVYRARVRV